MKKFISAILAVLVLSMLCGCEKGAEIHSEISETSRTETSAENISATSETAVTTAAKTTFETTKAATEETVTLTPLEEAQAWADEYPNRFLYDITGDGFPERLSFDLCEGAWYIYFYEDTEVYDRYFCIRTNGKAYVCRDTDGMIFIAACRDNDFVAGFTPYCASRYDFYSGEIKETSLPLKKHRLGLTNTRTVFYMISRGMVSPKGSIYTRGA